jgi:hypothetical protein
MEINPSMIADVMLSLYYLQAPLLVPFSLGNWFAIMAASI